MNKNQVPCLANTFIIIYMAHYINQFFMFGFIK